MRGSTYLRQARVLRIDHDPANLNDFRAVLGDVNAMLIARGCNVDDAVLIELRRRGRRHVLALCTLTRALGGEGSLRLSGLLRIRAATAMVRLPGRWCSHILCCLVFWNGPGENAKRQLMMSS